MKQETEPRTKKCFLCLRRFRLHDWQEGMERRINSRCLALLQFALEKEGLLSPREKKIISMRFGYENGKWTKNFHTLEEVGRESGVTRERVRQIEAKTFEKIQEIIPKVYETKN